MSHKRPFLRLFPPILIIALMNKIQIGDLFRVEGKNRQVLLHWVGNYQEPNPQVAQLVRVFYSPLDQGVDYSDLVAKPELYLIYFPLIVSHKKNLIEKIGNYPVPKDFQLPKFMRDPHIVRGKFLGWHIVEINTLQRRFVTDLSDEERTLSPFGIWNTPYLVDHLEKDWKLETWNFG